MEHILNQADNQLKQNGYTYIDLIDDSLLSERAINKAKKYCLKHWYQYFLERGMEMDQIKIDFDKTTNQYFKQPKDSPMFKAMYGQLTKNGKFYTNVRKPANSQSCGMGLATSQPAVYKEKKLIKIKEKLRPIFNHLYHSNTHLHLSRFGLKLPFNSSKDMVLHTDMSYLREYKNTNPPRRNINDPVSYSSYSDDGNEQRIQALLCLSDSDSGWYGYPGAHLKYKEIGEKLNWPGKTEVLQKIPVELMDQLNLKRVDVKSKKGRLILWNCGVPHGNSACKNTTPRLVLYINYQPNDNNTSAEKIIGLGNQPVGK